MSALEISYERMLVYLFKNVSFILPTMLVCDVCVAICFEIIIIYNLLKYNNSKAGSFKEIHWNCMLPVASCLNSV